MIELRTTFRQGLEYMWCVLCNREICDNPQFGTNSFLERGVPDFEFFWRLPITERGSLFQNGDPISEWFQIGDSFPKSPICNGNYSRTVSDWTIPILKQGCSHSLFWKWDPHFGMGLLIVMSPFWNGDLRFRTGSTGNPVLKWGSCHASGFWLCMQRTEKSTVSILKRGVPIQLWVGAEKIPNRGVPVPKKSLFQIGD
jgi:hypothetical protein